MDKVTKALKERFVLQEEYLGNDKPIDHITPLVSVTVTTYQHVNYIRECLEGVLMQKTDFPYEIILGEDGSTDGTQEICKEYAERYSNNIRLFIRDRKLSQYLKKDGSTIRFNGVWNRMSARGKYVAWCEGDDYWTDPLKLQKQVDFMESHPDYSLCFHATDCIYAHSNFSYLIIKKDSCDFTIEDLILGGGGFMATNSMLFRSEYVRDVSAWVIKAPVGDLPLMLLLGTNGKVHYIDEIMSVYRVSSGGWTSTIGKSTRKIKKYYSELYVMLDDFDEWSNLKYHKWVVIYKGILHQNYHKEICMCYLKRLLGDKRYYKLHKIYLGLKSWS